MKAPSLAGAVAAMWTTMDHLPGVNSEKIIGWVGGMDIPVLHDFWWATNRVPPLHRSRGTGTGSLCWQFH